MSDSGLFGKAVKEYLEKTGSKNKEYDAGLDGLIDDSDKVDAEHAVDIVTDARVKAHFPDTIANILTDHDKAAHDPLGINADQVDGADAGIAADDVFKIPAAIAQGDVFYADATPNLVRLLAGTSGHFLKTQGAAANPIWAAVAAGGGDACLVVAANDTPATLKDRADYACDGVSDQLEINTALGIADSIVFCPGTFILDGTILMGDNQSLIGSGPASILKRKDSSAAMDIIANADNVGGNINLMVANLMIDGNEANNASAGDGIQWQMVNYSKITNCWLFNCYSDAIKLGGSGIPLKSTKYCIVEDCIMENNGYGPSIEYGSDYCIVKGCIIRKTGKIAIYLKQSDNLSIIGNTIFESSQDTHNTYDHMTINGTASNHADFINIRDNIIRQGAEANKARYAVNIVDSDCNHTLIANNDCWDACAGVTTFVDSGTNTNWGAGNRKKDGTWAVGV